MSIVENLPALAELITNQHLGKTPHSTYDFGVPAYFGETAKLANTGFILTNGHPARLSLETQIKLRLIDIGGVPLNSQGRFDFSIINEEALEKGRDLFTSITYRAPHSSQKRHILVAMMEPAIYKNGTPHGWIHFAKRGVNPNLIVSRTYYSGTAEESALAIVDFVFQEDDNVNTISSPTDSTLSQAFSQILTK